MMTRVEKKRREIHGYLIAVIMERFFAQCISLEKFLTDKNSDNQTDLKELENKVKELDLNLQNNVNGDKLLEVIKYFHRNLSSNLDHLLQFCQESFQQDSEKVALQTQNLPSLGLVIFKATLEAFMARHQRLVQLLSSQHCASTTSFVLKLQEDKELDGFFQNDSLIVYFKKYQKFIL